MIQEAGAGVTENFILYISAGECSGLDPGNTATEGKYCQSSKVDTGFVNILNCLVAVKT